MLASVHAIYLIPKSYFFLSFSFCSWTSVTEAAVTVISVHMDEDLQAESY